MNMELHGYSEDGGFVMNEKWYHDGKEQMDTVQAKWRGFPL